jgi:hypothetical protein
MEGDEIIRSLPAHFRNTLLTLVRTNKNPTHRFPAKRQINTLNFNGNNLPLPAPSLYLYPLPVTAPKMGWLLQLQYVLVSRIHSQIP